MLKLLICGHRSLNQNVSATVFYLPNHAASERVDRRFQDVLESICFCSVSVLCGKQNAFPRGPHAFWYRPGQQYQTLSSQPRKKERRAQQFQQKGDCRAHESMRVAWKYKVLLYLHQVSHTSIYGFSSPRSNSLETSVISGFHQTEVK